VVAAAERFAVVGYHAARLSEIVSLSGVTKGAMYFHFPHKEAVADAVIAATHESFLRCSPSSQPGGWIRSTPSWC